MSTEWVMFVKLYASVAAVVLSFLFLEVCLLTHIFHRAREKVVDDVLHNVVVTEMELFSRLTRVVLVDVNNNKTLLSYVSDVAPGVDDVFMINDDKYIVCNVRHVVQSKHCSSKMSHHVGVKRCTTTVF